MDSASALCELATMTRQTDRRASKFHLRQILTWIKNRRIWTQIKNHKISTWIATRRIFTRIKNVTRFNAEGVLEIKEDRQATGQSIAVLVLATLLSGVGFEVFNELGHSSLSPYGIIVGGLANTISFSFASVVWSIMLFFVGTKLFQGKTGYWELARPMFFSAAPGALFILVSIPIRVVYISVTIIAAVWVVLSQSFALKQVMGFNVERTLLTVGVGFLILLFLGLIFQTR